VKNRNVRLGALLITLVLIAALSASFGCGSKEKAETQANMNTEKTTTYGKAVDAAKEATAALSNPEKGIDPVCGMVLSDNMVVAEVNGKKYGFCSETCAEAFKANPEKYLGSTPDSESE
jgi:YHS domain-containing protein